MTQRKPAATEIAATSQEPDVTYTGQIRRQQPLPKQVRNSQPAYGRHEIGAHGSETVMFALARAVEHRDPHIGEHCERLAFMSVSLGNAMRLDSASLVALYRGGYLHDIGKVAMPDSILFKPAELNEDEWRVMRAHTIRGEEICRHMPSLAPVLPIIRHHHEKWDGSGYPDGLRGSQIPLLARILQVADIYDALTSERPYKAALPPTQAIQIMEDETARGWRDPEIMALFLRQHREITSKISEFAADAASTSLHNIQHFLAAESASAPVAACRAGS
jgi:HD-GYP domain-containing protein (c-di-GMP phosphodiesterase class II)